MGSTKGEKGTFSAVWGELQLMLFVPVLTRRQSRALACSVCTQAQITQQRLAGEAVVVKKQRRDCRQRDAMEP